MRKHIVMEVKKNTLLSVWKSLARSFSALSGHDFFSLFRVLAFFFSCKAFVFNLSDCSLLANINTTLQVLHLGRAISCNLCFPNLHIILGSLCISRSPSYSSVQLYHSLASTSFSAFFLPTHILMLSRQLLLADQTQDLLKWSLVVKFAVMLLIKLCFWVKYHHGHFRDENVTMWICSVV